MPRILGALGSRGIRASAATNAAVIKVYPKLAEAIRAADWEFVGHGYHQRSQAMVPDERRVIEDSAATIESFTGRRPRGWLGPGLHETMQTPDLLRELGFDYVCDWVVDDLPEWMETRHGRLLAMPYSLDLNDSVIFAVERQSSAEMYRRVMDTVEYFDAKSREQQRVLTLPLHPHLTGVPHRMLYFERVLDTLLARPDTVFMTGSEIADWFVSAEALVGKVTN